MYLNNDAANAAIQNLASTYPSLCSLITLPNVTIPGNKTSYALKLGGGVTGSRDVFVMTGCHHAREWGSCEVLIFLATDLLQAYTGNTGLAYGGKSFTAAQIKTLLDTLHVVMFPLVNPDGRFESMTGDPLWRKNRNPANSGGSPDPHCIGIDLNRNYSTLFDFRTAFAPTSGVVVSDQPCNYETYHGPQPFSEVETQNVKWLMDAFPTTRWYVDVHSFAEDMLFSWGDDDSQYADPSQNFQNPAFDGKRGIKGDAYGEFVQSDDLAVVKQLANRFASDLKLVRNKTYTVKSSFDLYPTSGTSTDYAFSRHQIDPSKGKIYGFTIEWGAPAATTQLSFQPLWSEMANIIMDVDAGLIGMCLAAQCAGGLTVVTLKTPVLNFNDIPAGVETSRAIVFSVETCSIANFDVVSGPAVLSGPGSFNVPLGNVALTSATTNAERTAYLWVSFKGTNPGDITKGTVTVKCLQTGENFVIPINANTIVQPSVASMLVLDQSGSMDFASGVPNKKRIDILHSSAPDFVNLLPDIDGVGVVAFDQSAYLRTGVAAGLAGRNAASAKIAAHSTNPNGSTSIGNGVERAHNELVPVNGFTNKAVVVFTDGEENTYKFISDVKSMIDDRVFAIGLGTAQQVNPLALNALVSDTGGYLLLTDQLGPNDNLRLAKYFVQISAGVTNTEVVVDPEGYLGPGVELKIPFGLSNSDYGCDAIVLSPFLWAFDFQLETPAGVRIKHASLGGVVGVEYNSFSEMSFYRLSLPVVAGAAAHQGRWFIVLTIPLNYWKKYLSAHDTGSQNSPIGVPYNAIVHARSNLTMRASLSQSSYVPGTDMHLRAVLTDIGLPLEGRAEVRAGVKYPDASQTTVVLSETSPGVFEADVVAPISGVYPVHFYATGKSLRGSPFTREQLRTGMAWQGGDDSPPSGPPKTGNGWCDLLHCLLDDKGIQRWLKENHIDAKALEECLCQKPPVLL
jgi:murein tripeptide amidase MpaA